MNMQIIGIFQGATQCFIEHIGVFRFKKIKPEKLDVNLMLTGYWDLSVLKNSRFASMT